LICPYVRDPKTAPADEPMSLAASAIQAFEELSRLIKSPTLTDKKKNPPLPLTITSCEAGE